MFLFALTTTYNLSFVLAVCIGYGLYTHFTHKEPRFVSCAMNDPTIASFNVGVGAGAAILNWTTSARFRKAIRPFLSNRKIADMDFHVYNFIFATGVIVYTVSMKNSVVGHAIGAVSFFVLAGVHFLISFPALVKSVRSGETSILKILNVKNTPAINFWLTILTFALFMMAPITMFYRKYVGDGNHDILQIMLEAGYIVQCDNVAEQFLDNVAYSFCAAAEYALILAICIDGIYRAYVVKEMGKLKND